MRVRPAGDRSVLVELDSPAARRALDDALLAAPPAGLVEAVPALTTLLLTFASPAALAAALTSLREAEPAPAASDRGGDAAVVSVAVHYDGPDLADVAAHLGIGPHEVVARHTGGLWRVDFTGFMPGFGYLTCAAAGLDVPRLPSPRTRVPAGSVALAGGFTGVYPQASPGGWRLIGRTDAVLFDPDASPPALFMPGRRVRFVDADRR